MGHQRGDVPSFEPRSDASHASSSISSSVAAHHCHASPSSPQRVATSSITAGDRIRRSFPKQAPRSNSTLGRKSRSCQDGHPAGVPGRARGEGDAVQGGRQELGSTWSPSSERQPKPKHGSIGPVDGSLGITALAIEGDSRRSRCSDSSRRSMANDAAVAAWLRELLWQHGVLCIRQQAKLDDDEHASVVADVRPDQGSGRPGRRRQSGPLLRRAPDHRRRVRAHRRVAREPSAT